MPLQTLAANAAREELAALLRAHIAPGRPLTSGINQTMAKKSPKKPTKAKAAAKAKKSPAKHAFRA